MDVSSLKSVAAYSSAVATQRAQETAGVAVYKKALDVQAETVTSLLASAVGPATASPGTGAASPQPNLGQRFYGVA